MGSKRGRIPIPKVKKLKDGRFGATIAPTISYTNQKITIKRKCRADAQSNLDLHLSRIENYGKSAKGLTPEIESAVITGLNSLSYEPTPDDIKKIFDDHDTDYQANLSTETFTELWTKVMREINPDFAPEKVGISDRGLNFTRHYSSMRHIGKRFNEKHGDRLVVKINRKDIINFVDGTGVSKTSKTSYRQALGAIFADAVERCVIDENPCWSNSKRKNNQSGGKKNKSLPLDKIRLILMTMPEELVPYYTICIFAGLRQEEIMNLMWDDVIFEENVIIVRDPKGSTTNDTPNRCPQILPPLNDWLKPFKGMTGPVFPKEWKKTKVYNHRREIGLLVDGIGKKENYKLYPSNTLRHVACTGWSARFGRAVAAQQVGNSEKRQASNYDHVWKKSQAEEFFGYTPEYINKLKDKELIGDLLETVS